MRSLVIEVGGPIRAARAGRVALGSRRGLLLRLEDRDGCWGQGEASPLPGYSPDAIEECRDQLEAMDWPDLADEDPLAALERRALAPAARFAAETAFLDLAGRRRGVPVSTLLRGSPAPAPVPLSALLPDGPADVVVAAVRSAPAIRTFKLKVGRPDRTAEEIDIARAARDAIGPDGALRLDANRAWSPAQAEAALRALAPIGIELIEEPVASWRELPLPAPVPVAADESLQPPEAEEELAERAERGACHALVLKPMALGGFARCLRLARLADRLGLGVVVTHLFDGPVGLAAAAELALALRSPWACGLGRHAGLEAWPPVPIAQLSPAAIVPAPGPGLGLPDLSSRLA